MPYPLFRHKSSILLTLKDSNSIPIAASITLPEGEHQSRNSLFCFADETHKGESILAETQLVLADKHISFTTA